MVRGFAVLALIALAGCAPFADEISDLENGCEAKHAEFVAVVDCLKMEVAKGGLQEGRDADLTKLYLTMAAVVAEQVQQGTISDVEARFEMAKAVAMLKSVSNLRTGNALQGLGAGMQSGAAAAQRYRLPPPAPPTRPLNCVDYGGGIIKCR